MLTVKGELVFKDSLVGYRVEHKGTQFDISQEDFHLVQEDFKTKVMLESRTYEIHLAEKGNQLIPVNATNARELTYGLYASLKGVDRLAKTDGHLKRLYNQYNKLCFNNELPVRVGVEWSNRMTAGAGYCRRFKKPAGGFDFLIKLSTHYHHRHPDEVIDTLVHEMIHVYHPLDHHGPKFKATMNRLNEQFGFEISVYATSRALTKYTYACEDCGYEYERAKRINTNRARCGAGSCRGVLYMKEDHTEDMFDDTDWGEW